MHVDDEIARLRIIDGPLGGAAPSLEGTGIIGKDANDVETREVFEFNLARQILEFPAKYEVEELFAHGVPAFVVFDFGRVMGQIGARVKAGCGQFEDVPAIRSMGMKLTRSKSAA